MPRARGSLGLVCVVLALLAFGVAGCGGGSGASTNPSPATEPQAPGTECDPNYEGACLDPNAVDYDCAGGSGNGPLYTGPVTVVGEDHHGLDRDNDGLGCES